jgi:8-oxo-dGTP pyrophosphatase MutT (NUDIX family)
VHGERVVYQSPWVSLCLADVEVPGERRFEHHVVRIPAEAAGTVVFDPERGVLLLWRHRFIPDAWGFEVPAGRIEPGEEAGRAAAREVLEETGWEPGPLRHLVSFNPAPGISDHRFNIYVADGAVHRGEPTDPGESERVEWVPVEALRGLLLGGQVPDGLTLAALLYALTAGVLDAP